MTETKPPLRKKLTVWKFCKVTALTTLAFGTVLFQAGLLNEAILSVLAAGSTFAGAIYALDNYRRHR